MGGTSKQQQQVSQNTSQDPWAPAVPLASGIAQQAQGLLPYTGINPAESEAFRGLMTNAGAGNPYSQQIGGVANTLLGGGGFDQLQGPVTGAQSAFEQRLNPFANGQMVGTNSPQFQKVIDTLTGGISDKINAYYAGAGRDLSEANARGLSRGLSEGLAPAFLQQYNTDIERQLGAAKDLYGSAGTTAGLLGNLTGQGLAARGTGIDAATAALAARDSPYNQQLAIQAAMRGIPIQQLGQLAQIGVPIAQLGGTGTRQGTIDQTTQMSPAQQAWGWTQAFGNLFGGAGGGSVPNATKFFLG